MVTFVDIGDFAVQWVIFAERHVLPPLEQMTPPKRAAVIMALLALTLTGLFLIILVMVGGHWVRRLARHRPARRHVDTAAASNRQLTEALQAILPELKTGDTVLLDTPSKDTKAGN